MQCLELYFLQDGNQLYCVSTNQKKKMHFCKKRTIGIIQFLHCMNGKIVSNLVKQIILKGPLESTQLSTKDTQ